MVKSGVHPERFPPQLPLVFGYIKEVPAMKNDIEFYFR